MTRSCKKNRPVLAVPTTMHRTFAADIVCELSTVCDIDAGGWLAPEDRAMDLIDATASRARKSIILRNAALSDETRQRMAALSEATRGVGPAPDVVIMVFSDLSCLVYAAGRASQGENPSGLRPPRMMLLDPQPRAFPRSIKTEEGTKLFSFVNSSDDRPGATPMARGRWGHSDKTLCLGRPKAWLPFDMTPGGRQSACNQSACNQSACNQLACDAITTAATSIAGAIPDLPGAFLTDASGVRRQGMPPHTPFPPFLGHQSWTDTEKTKVSEVLKQIMLLHASEQYSFVDGLSDADRDSLTQKTLAVKFISGLGKLADNAQEKYPTVRITAPTGAGARKKENLEIAKKVEAAVNADLSAIFDTSIFFGSLFLARVSSSIRFGPSSIVITKTFLVKGVVAPCDKLSGHQALRLRGRIEEAKAARAMMTRHP